MPSLQWYFQCLISENDLIVYIEYNRIHTEFDKQLVKFVAAHISFC